MNTVIQKQLDRVESALTTLIESITSFNPSITAAHDLLSADDGFTRDLDQLSTHQSNHAYILSLRATSAALSATQTSKLATLSIARELLLSTPTQPAQENPALAVPYDDILSYARNISRYSAPAHFRPAALLAEAVQQDAPQNSTAAANGAGEPTSANGPPGPETSAPAVNPGLSMLTLAEKAWLDPNAQTPFLPWPSEEIIRRGALARLQTLAEQGVDCVGLEVAGDGSGDVVMEDGKEDHEDVKDEELVKLKDAGGERAERVRVEARREEKPSVFGGLDLYDPDDE